MRSLFALDKLFAFCRVEREASEEVRNVGQETGGATAAAAVQATGREGQSAGLAGRARAERTGNISPITVTLETSKLSGWLNADAHCRVVEEGGMQGWVVGGRGVAAAQAVRRAGPTVVVAGRARAERTANMDPMFVTLEVSKLSGWLNAHACCRVERGA